MNQSNLNQNEPRPETQNVTPKTTNEIELPKFASEEKSIGTLKKDTQKSPVAMLILFGILIAVIYFIPIVTPYFSDILDKLGISNNSEIYDGIQNNDTTKDNTDTKDDTQKEMSSISKTKKIYNAYEPAVNDVQSTVDIQDIEWLFFFFKVTFLDFYS